MEAFRDFSERQPGLRQEVAWVPAAPAGATDREALAPLAPWRFGCLLSLVQNG